MIPQTVTRVRDHTVDESNARIRCQTEENIALFGNAGQETPERRLAEPDYEWDIERALQANAGSFILPGCLLGATVDLLQHGVQGWCPPVGLFRRLAFRTATEIDYERYALKATRGDFRNAPSANHKDCAEINRLLQNVER